MIKYELVRLVFINLKKSPVRLALTSLGVAIGSALIILMISIGQSLKKNIIYQLSSLGVDYITVFPNGKNRSLSDEDIRKIFFLDKVSNVIPLLLLQNAKIKFAQKTINSQIIGISPYKLDEINFKIKKGATLFNSDYPIAVVGNYFGSGFKTNSANIKNIHQELLNTPIILLLKRKNNIQKFYKIAVIGILQERGGSYDYTLFLPQKIVRNMMMWQNYTGILSRRGNFNQLIVKVKNSKFVLHVAGEIKKMGFIAFTSKESIESVNKIYLVLQVLLGSIGFIALLVSAFGIINTMMTAVYERKKEIGIMKAVGARIEEIRDIFLAESAAIGFIGGITGIIFSFFFLKIIALGAPILIKKYSAQFNFLSNIHIAGGTLLVALLFSVVLGLAAGAYPAILISKSNDADILRYE